MRAMNPARRHWPFTPAVVSLCLGAAFIAPVMAQDALGPLLHPAHDTPLVESRVPLRLSAPMAARQKANMRAHLEAVQGIVAALATGDWAGVAKVSSSMGASPGMLRMCRHMGEGNPPDFTARAIAFHESADRIAAAASARDRDATLAALATTLANCTGCHAVYRQEIVAAP